MRPVFFVKVFFLIVLLSIISCEDKDYEITSINPIKLPEVSEVFRIEEGVYSEAFVVDSFIIMTSLNSLDGEIKRIHVYNKENLQLITKFGTVGLASFELPSISPLTSIQNSDNLLFYDFKTWNLKTINLDRFLLDGNIANAISSMPLDRNLFGSINLLILNDHKYAGIYRRDALEGKGMFYIYDTQKQEKNMIAFRPKVKVEKNYLRMLYTGYLSVNNPKEIIFFATTYFDQVLFYDFEGNLLKQHVFSPLKKPLLSRQSDSPEFPGSYIYASEVISTSQYFFFERLGTKSKEHISPQLLIFTWDGLLVKSFEFPVDQNRFFYDEEFGNLYTLETGDEENDPHIIVRKYKIGDYLHTNHIE